MNSLPPRGCNLVVLWCSDVALIWTNDVARILIHLLVLRLSSTQPCKTFDWISSCAEGRTDRKAEGRV